MTKVGAQRAADLTGRSKSTIQRAMTAGKLSYETDETGHRLIDVSELERLFGLKPDGASAGAVASEDAAGRASEDRIASGPVDGAELEVLRARIAALEAQLDEVRAQRDAWQAQAQDAIATCQTAQKQVDVFAETIRERDRKEDERRRQIIEARANRAAGKPARPAAPAIAENQNSPADESLRKTPAEESDDRDHESDVENRADGEGESSPESGGLLDFHGLWHRIKSRAGAA